MSYLQRCGTGDQIVSLGEANLQAICCYQAQIVQATHGSILGRYPFVCHQRGPGSQEEGTSQESGIDRVITQAAKDLFADYDGKDCTHHGKPIGRSHGDIEGEQHTGEEGRTIRYTDGYLAKLLHQSFRDHCRNGSQKGEDQALDAPKPDCGNQSRDKGDHHIPHHHWDIGAVMQMGSRSNY